MSTERVDFTRAAAERIANVVRIVETGDRDGAPLRFGRAIAGGGGGAVFRVCTFTGAWAKNATTVVTLKYNTTTPNTFVAMNLFAEIASSTATRNCAIAKQGTAWFLIAAEC